MVSNYQYIPPSPTISKETNPNWGRDLNFEDEEIKGLFDLQLDLQDLYIDDLFPSSDEESLDDVDLKLDVDDVHGPFSCMWIYTTFLTYDDFSIVLFVLCLICIFVVCDEFKTLFLCLLYDFLRVCIWFVAAKTLKAWFATNHGFWGNKPPNMIFRKLFSNQIQEATCRIRVLCDENICSLRETTSW